MPLRTCSTSAPGDRSACARSVPDASPVDLCDLHLARAAEFAAEEAGIGGVEDVLLSPCVLCGSRLGVRYPSGVLCAVCEWRVGEIPDADVAPPRVDLVYYIRFGGRIKIGTTANPAQRLAALWHEELIAFERGDRRVEHRRHEQFAAERLGRSEWFTASPALTEHAEALAGGIDPWDRHRRWLSEALALGSAR